jgi:general secretion pathway protein L
VTSTALMREKIPQRLIVFVPPRSSMAGRSQVASSTVVDYLAPGSSVRGQTPIALLPKAGSVDLVFAAGDVFITAVDAPKLSEGKLRLALPNMLEERLLADPGDCHFAFSLRRSSGDTTTPAQPNMPVAVIDRGLLTRALDAVTESGYRVRAAYSEIYTVPPPAGGVLSVRVDRGRGIARAGLHDGFAFEVGDELPPTLAIAVRRLDIKRIHAYGKEAAKIARMAEALDVKVEVQADEIDVASIDAAVNLLQGAFAQGGMMGSLGAGGSLLSRLGGRTLRVPMIWAGVAVVVAVVGMNAYYWKLDGESKAIRSQMEASFRSNFPQSTAVVDPIEQTRRQLSDLRARSGVPSANDFSVLNARTALLLSVAPVGSVAGMEYRDGALKVKFKPGTADNPGLQNSLRSAAVQHGLTIRFEGDGSARITASGM